MHHLWVGLSSEHFVFLSGPSAHVRPQKCCVEKDSALSVRGMVTLISVSFTLSVPPLLPASPTDCCTRNNCRRCCWSDNLDTVSSTFDGLALARAVFLLARSGHMGQTRSAQSVPCAPSMSSPAACLPVFPSTFICGTPRNSISQRQSNTNPLARRQSHVPSSPRPVRIGLSRATIGHHR